MSLRFSDAELACEWLRVDADVTQIGEWNSTFDPSWSRVDNRDEDRHAEIHAIIYRFATLPHAHEEPGAYVFQCENCDAYWETDNEEHRNTFARNHQYLAHQRQGQTK